MNTTNELCSAASNGEEMKTKLHAAFRDHQATETSLIKGGHKSRSKSGRTWQSGDLDGALKTTLEANKFKKADHKWTTGASEEC